jgi:hypothetical protein
MTSSFYVILISIPERAVTLVRDAFAWIERRPSGFGLSAA